MGQEYGEIWSGQALLQPISFKSDRLLGSACVGRAMHAALTKSSVTAARREYTIGQEFEGTIRLTVLTRACSIRNCKQLC